MKLVTHSLRKRSLLACAGVGVLLTAAAPAWAYRTAGDLDEFEGTRRVGWEGGITSFVLVDDLPGGVGGVDATADLVRSALRSWTDAPCTSLLAGLEGVSGAAAQYGDSVNSIQWLRSGWEERGFQPGASGATDLRYEEVEGTWMIVEADVYLNFHAHDWSTSLASEEDDDVEILGVLTHELGHALGLMHPCEEGGEPECTDEHTDEPSTMFPAYSHGQNVITQDDRRGICFLYRACTEDECGEGQECTRQGCAEVCGDVTCEVGEECRDGECFDWSDPCQVDPISCITCEEADDCGDGYLCRDGACLFDLTPAGDPCGRSTTCASGECGEAGYCTPGCSTDEECGENGRCDEESRECTRDSREPLGGPCDSADDCLGERCLSELSDEPMCTRPCDEEHDDCPLDWSCGEADDEPVCVPPTPPFNVKGCGCSQVGTDAPLHPLIATSLFGLGAFFTRRRRQFSTNHQH